ncbi:MAG: hypothetical protein DHS20C18_36850 [Saprospiraceae bacterium]|nr:MAG: hypothetical protein DHS20C18_36850 [Saprospiraceae bacterium]
MKQYSLFVVALFALLNFTFANGGYHIEVKIDGYESEQLLLAYHLGDKQYIQDTVQQNDQGKFVFSGEEKLPCGVYLLVMQPENQFFQLLIDQEEQEFSVTTSKEDPLGDAKFTGSPDNSLFYSYLNYLNNKRPEAENLKKALDEEGSNQKKLQKKLDDLNEEVINYQHKLVKDNPGTLTAAIINASLTVDMPEFSGDQEHIREQQWRYMQVHYFDNLDLSNSCMTRTPFLFQRVDYFINKLQIQHPDTISKAIDYVLEKMRPSEENFKFYLIHFLNEFAKSKMVGMDAVYVHLVDNYYAKGDAPWVEADQLKKIEENAAKLKPLLIGKIAPDINLQKRDGTPISLHGVDAEYTILYFWRYDCGHCKKSTPDMKAFYGKFKDKGVKIVAICTKFTDEIPDCWKYVDENETQDWLHTVDPYHQSKFMKLYDISTTPQIYILDRNKEIISKKIGAEQLEEVMDRIIEMKQKQASEDTN